MEHLQRKFQSTTEEVQIKSDKVCFQSGQGSALVKEEKSRLRNDDAPNRKIAASNKTFTFGFKQNYETNRN